MKLLLYFMRGELKRLITNIVMPITAVTPKIEPIDKAIILFVSVVITK